MISFEWKRRETRETGDCVLCLLILLGEGVRKKADCPLHSFVAIVQLLSHVQLFATPWPATRQAPLSSTVSQSLLKLKSIESLMPSNRPLHPLLPPSSLALRLSPH